MVSTNRHRFAPLKLTSPQNFNSRITNVRPRKSLSQNFLTDDDSARKIVDSLDLSQKDVVLEIGAGTGALTGHLLGKAKRVVAVELDRRLCTHLERKLAGRENLEIIHGDILKADLVSLIGCPGKCKVVGNLPYKITSPVLQLLLNHRNSISLCVLMVQKEVALRICAKPGIKDWSPLSIAVQLHSEVKVLFHLQPGSFFPAPRVDSSVIRLKFLSKARIALPDEARFFRVVRSAFGQRRKTVLNSLAASLDLPKEDLRLILSDLGIDPQRRPEALSIEEYAGLASALGKAVK